jgi:hypothetical protein
MKVDVRRITLVARDKQSAERAWNFYKDAAGRIVMLQSLAMLRSTVASPLVRSDADIERIVLDRCCSESEFLSFLAALPHEFTGDVLMIREQEESFLSATGRGGGRILYALTDNDVEFYLETACLVRQTEAFQRGVLKFHPRVVEVVKEHTSSSSLDSFEHVVRSDDSQARQRS